MTNPCLPVKAFLQLTSALPGIVSGKTITYAWPNPLANTTYYTMYYSGLTIKTVQLSPDYSATLPNRLIRTFYTIVVSSFSLPLSPLPTPSIPYRPPLEMEMSQMPIL
jgi:hypothetical protein